MSEASSSFCGSGIFPGESSAHNNIINKYSAHLPHSTFKLPDSEGRAFHRPSKPLTFFSVSDAGFASNDIHAQPKVGRHLQQRSRFSKLFPSNAWVTNSELIYFIDYDLASLSCGLPLSPNWNALVSITHCWRKLPGTQASFDVATETLSSSGFFLSIQKEKVFDSPS